MLIEALRSCGGYSPFGLAMAKIDIGAGLVYSASVTLAIGGAEMNVSVGREFEEFVRGKVESGDYASASEVVRDGLRLMREKELLLEARLQSLRGEIQKGIDQLERGESRDGETVMTELRAKLLSRQS